MCTSGGTSSRAGSFLAKPGREETVAERTRRSRRARRAHKALEHVRRSTNLYLYLVVGRVQPLRHRRVSVPRSLPATPYSKGAGSAGPPVVDPSVRAVPSALYTVLPHTSRGTPAARTASRTCTECSGPVPVWKSTSVSGAPDNSSLSHFSAMTWPRWLRRAARNRHRHAVEQVSRRWRGGRRGDSGQTRRKFDFRTGRGAAAAQRRVAARLRRRGGADRAGPAA